MTRDVADVLAQHATDYAVRRELHRVPPHITYEITLDIASYFLRSLLLQDQHDETETERRAEWAREHVADSLRDLRAAFG